MTWDGIDRRQQSDDTRDIVIQTHERVQNLCDLLLDNGQPGAISRLQSDINDLDTRMQSLEGWRRWVNGIGTAVGAVFTLIAALWRYVMIVRVGKGQ